MAKNKQYKQHIKPPIASQKITQNVDNQQVIQNKQDLNLNIWAVLGILAALVFISYFPVWQNIFVWDDKPYILLNEPIRDFSLRGISHLFTYFEQGNYHPLTMLSYMIEYALVKEKTWLYHLDNLILHTLNAWFVFRILQKLSSNNWLSFITAVLFAIHPMHVESVAWAAERKDVLYVFFLLLSFWQYLKFDETKKNSHYLVSCGLFLASCLSKGMAVVLPALLLITDYCFLHKPLTIKLLANKIPYFLITFIFAYIATIAQKTAGADASSVINATYSGFERLAIVCYSFCFYWLKTIVPIHLLGFYPYPNHVNGKLSTEFYLAILFAFFIVGCIYWFGKKDRQIWWGGAFFLIAISTVLQLFPIGSAIAADRYFYLSSIGILFLIALIINKLRAKFPAVTIVSSIVGLVLCGLTFRQTKVWKNQLTLFTPIVEKYPDDAMALSNVGWYYSDIKDFSTAKKYMLKALESGFKSQDICRTVGSMYLDEGDAKNAVKYYEMALQNQPTEDRTYWLAALAYAKMGDAEKSKFYYEKVKNMDTFSPAELTMMGSVFGSLGHFEEAKMFLKKAIAKQPDFWDAQLNYAFVFRQEKNLPEEVRLLEDLIKKAPNYLPAYKNIGVSLVDLGQWQKAIEFWQKAATIQPDGSYEYNIGIAYASHGDIPKAKEWHIKAARKGNQNAIDVLKRNGEKY